MGSWSSFYFLCLPSLIIQEANGPKQDSYSWFLHCPISLESKTSKLYTGYWRNIGHVCFFGIRLLVFKTEIIRILGPPPVIPPNPIKSSIPLLPGLENRLHVSSSKYCTGKQQSIHGPKEAISEWVDCCVLCTWNIFLQTIRKSSWSCGILRRALHIVLIPCHIIK